VNNMAIVDTDITMQAHAVIGWNMTNFYCKDSSIFVLIDDSTLQAKDVVFENMTFRPDLIPGAYPGVTYRTSLETCPIWYAENITQYNITWSFDKCYRVGQFVNGDWWVVGPVNITRISPDMEQIMADNLSNFTQMIPYWINGWDVNPTKKGQQAIDERAGGFNLSLSRSLPYIASPNESIIKFIGDENKYTSY